MDIYDKLQNMHMLYYNAKTTETMPVGEYSPAYRQTNHIWYSHTL